MNWDAIGAIGEVLGAILVGGTLIYLVVQVRQNTNLLEHSQKSGRVSADVQVVRLFSEWRMFSTQDGELADVFLRGLDDIDSLSPNEALRFNNLMQTFFWNCWQVLRLEDEGLFSMPNTVLYKDVLAHPGARAWYLSTRDQFGPLINSTFDPILEEIESTGYQHPEVDGRIVSSLLGGPVPNRSNPNSCSCGFAKLIFYDELMGFWSGSGRYCLLNSRILVAAFCCSAGYISNLLPRWSVPRSRVSGQQLEAAFWQKSMLPLDVAQ